MNDQRKVKRPPSLLERAADMFGLDPAGVIEAVGAQVHEVRPGDRVYVNPGRSCGSCGRSRGRLGHRRS